jgi:hypothetical protein
MPADAALQDLTQVIMIVVDKAARRQGRIGGDRDRVLSVAHTLKRAIIKGFLRKNVPTFIETVSREIRRYPR